MTTDQNTLIEELDALLDIERQALLEGDLERLAALVERKETLIDSLNEADIAASKPLSDVNEKVARNQSLLENALSGIRTVARRLAEIRQARKAFDTYNEQGQKSEIRSDDEISVEKRA